MTTLDPGDRLDLLDLVHRYAAGVDDRDFGAVGDLFADDGVLASPRPPRRLDPVDEAVGPAGVRVALARLEATVATQHAVVGHVFTADGPDVASGRIACTAHHVLPDGTHLVWHLTYRDRYRRTPHGWRIARRDLWVDVVEQRPLVAARGLT